MSMRGKFPLGQLVATRGVAASGINILPLIVRHAAGDWGDLVEEDKAQNETALVEGNRLMSAYKLDSDTTIWIITEWDRSVTTVLFPHEY